MVHHIMLTIAVVMKCYKSCMRFGFGVILLASRHAGRRIVWRLFYDVDAYWEVISSR